MRPDSCSWAPSLSSVAVIDWLSCGHRAGRGARRAALAAGVADAHDLVADRHLGGVTDGRGREAAGALQLDEGDVVGAVVADHVGGVRAAVADVGGLDGGGAGDHVVVGEHQPAGGEHDAGAGRLPGVLEQVGVDVDQLGRHLAGDGAGVGVVGAAAAVAVVAPEVAAGEEAAAVAVGVDVVRAGPPDAVAEAQSDQDRHHQQQGGDGARKGAPGTGGAAGIPAPPAARTGRAGRAARPAGGSAAPLALGSPVAVAPVGVGAGRSAVGVLAARRGGPGGTPPAAGRRGRWGGPAASARRGARRRYPRPGPARWLRDLLIAVWFWCVFHVFL